MWVFLFVAVVWQTARAATIPTFDIRVRHISDDKSYEDHWVHVGDEFFIADTDCSVKVKRFVPDFEMNMKTKKVRSRSNKPLNPALQLAVFAQDKLLYETWVLYQNLIPHAIHEPGYYFQFISYETLE